MALLDDLNALVLNAKVAFEAAGDAATLEAARIDFLGTRGQLKQLLGRMGEVPKEQKPAIGKRANEAGVETQAIFEVAKARIEALPSNQTGGGSSSYDALQQERLDKLKLYEEARAVTRSWLSVGREISAGQQPQSADADRRDPQEIRRTRSGTTYRSETATEEVYLAARVMLRRDQSRKLIFLTAQDQAGTIQVGLWNAVLNEDALATVARHTRPVGHRRRLRKTGVHPERRTDGVGDEHSNSVEMHRPAAR